MGMFDRFSKTEERALENPNAPVSPDDFLHIMGWGDFSSAAGVPQNLLGYNVVVNQDMDSIATAKKTILFGDMSYYYVRKVGQPAIYVARERFAPDFGILGYIRFDGVLSNTAAIKHLVQA